MINNHICNFCSVEPVCKIATTLEKFSESAKRPLGVNLTMDQCSHFVSDETNEGGDEQ